MLRYLTLAAALGLLTGPARARAEDTYTIKFKEAAKGDRSLVEKQSTEQGRTKILDADGKAVLDKEQNKATVSLYRETVLEKPLGERKPTRSKRRYEKARRTAGGKEEKLAFEGKTVLIEKKDDAFRFTVEGGEELSPLEGHHRDKEFNKKNPGLDEAAVKHVLLPTKPVKVNEPWKADAASIVKDME